MSTTSTTIEDRITNTELTKTEQMIAEYILHNYSTVGFKTATDIAVTLGISDSSVIRFSRALGYNGFNEMKNEIKSEMTNKLKNPEEFDFSLLSPYQKYVSNMNTLSTGNTASKHFEHILSGIQDVITKNAPEKFEKFVELLKSSRKKYIYGFRSASFAAQFFGFELVFLTPNVIVNTDADAKAVERMADLSSEDCVVLFTYPRYGKMNFIIKKMVEDAGAKLIVVVDKLTSPVTTGADLVLTCNPQSLSFYNSVIPMFFICETVINMMSKQDSVALSHKLKSLMSYLDADELY